MEEARRAWKEGVPSLLQHVRGSMNRENESSMTIDPDQARERDYDWVLSVHTPALSSASDKRT